MEICFVPWIQIVLSDTQVFAQNQNIKGATAVLNFYFLEGFNIKLLIKQPKLDVQKLILISRLN